MCVFGRGQDNSNSSPTTVCVVFYGHIPWDVMFKYFQCFWIYFIAVLLLFVSFPVLFEGLLYIHRPLPWFMTANWHFMRSKLKAFYALWLALVSVHAKGSIVDVIVVFFERFDRLWIRHEAHVAKDCRHHKCCRLSLSLFLETTDRYIEESNNC